MILIIKRVLAITILLLSVSAVFAQVKKPTIMVVPSDVWCFQNNYTITFENDGASMLLPNHKLALQSNSDLLMAISKINTLMADRGFPLKDLNATIKAVERQSAENEILGIQENPIDRLYRTARADIILQLTWTVGSVGPKKSVTYNLQGIDSYTNKQIAGAQGTGAPSFSADVATLLQEAVMANMDSFCNQLMSHFEDLNANGREITADLMISDESTIDFEDEFNGKELAEIIYEWLTENTVNKQFGTSYSSDKLIMIEQVRIPLYKNNGSPLDAEGFLRTMRDFLRKTYSIQSKVISQGLGRSILIISE